MKTPAASTTRCTQGLTSGDLFASIGALIKKPSFLLMKRLVPEAILEKAVGESDSSTIKFGLTNVSPESPPMSEFQHDVKFAEACNGGKIEVRTWARTATDEELRNAFDQVSPTNVLTEILKVERDFRAARATEARLLAVETGIRQMQATLSRPEHKSWMFWLALTAAVFAILAVLRDYWNFQVSPPASAAPISSPAPADTNATDPKSEPSSK